MKALSDIICTSSNAVKIVEQLPIRVAPNPHNVKYLRTKREKMGHLIENLDD